MLFSSPLQLLVLCAVAVVAWLLGFATNPTSVNRGKAVRKLTRDFATFRTQSQNRLTTLARHAATLETSYQTVADRLAEAEARIAAFKASAAAERTPVATAPQPAPAPDDAAHPTFEHDPTDPIVPPLTPGETAAPPVGAEPFPELANGDHPAPIGPPSVPEPAHGWLGSGARDALTRIDGIDTALDLRLAELGITRFEDIEKLSDQDEMALELRLALPAGYITGRQWRQQAAALRTAR